MKINIETNLGAHFLELLKSKTEVLYGGNISVNLHSKERQRAIHKPNRVQNALRKNVLEIRNMRRDARKIFMLFN